MNSSLGAICQTVSAGVPYASKPLNGYSSCGLQIPHLVVQKKMSEHDRMALTSRSLQKASQIRRYAAKYPCPHGWQEEIFHWESATIGVLLA